MQNITILGTGAYGKALAQILTKNGYSVILWGIVEQEIIDINQHQYQNINLNHTIFATNDLNHACANCDIIIFAVPAKSVDLVSKKINNFVEKATLVINATKGLNPETGERLSVIIKRNLSNKINFAGIYGPSLANEIMNYYPTQVTAVSDNIKFAKQVKALFNNDNFLVTISNDLIGIEFLSAIKNVIGILAGILKAQKVSDSTFASLIAIAINEAMFYITKQGGKLATILTQAGIGDLILSTTLTNSRNYKFGYQIGNANNIKKVIQESNMTVEGFLTCKIIHQTKIKLNLTLPLFELIYKVLFQYQNPKIIIDYFKSLN